MGYRPEHEIIGQDDELIARDIHLAQVIERAVPWAECYRTVIDRSARRWSDRAACKGKAETMYPTAGEPVEPALELCRSCPVIELCCAWGDECEPTRRPCR